MNKIILVALFFVVASTSIAGPRIECEQKSYDFGTMHDGHTAEHTYTIKNTGDTVLNIGKIRACCGSTAVISATTIEPGKTAELKAKLPLRNRYGKQDKNIFIASNDPKMPYLQLKFIGEVKRRVVIEPRSVSFKDLKLGENAEQVVSITSSLPMNIVKIESSSKAFLSRRVTERTEKALLTTKNTTGLFVYKIETVGDKLVKGLNRGRITLHTDNKEYPQIRIYCRAQVEDTIKVTPSEIVLKKSDKTVTRYIAVRSIDAAFKVSDVVLPYKEMKVSHKPRGKNAYLFIVSNIPADEVLDGKCIVIKTDYDNGREIEIPFSVKN